MVVEFEFRQTREKLTCSRAVNLLVGVEREFLKVTMVVKEVNYLRDDRSNLKIDAEITLLELSQVNLICGCLN